MFLLPNGGGGGAGTSRESSLTNDEGILAEGGSSPGRFLLERSSVFSRVSNTKQGVEGSDWAEALGSCPAAVASFSAEPGTVIMEFNLASQYVYSPP